MEKEKKKWETPKLVCLYRGRPEESVLYYCKGTAAEGPSANKCKTGATECEVRNAT